MASPDSENHITPLAPKLGVGKIISATLLIYLQNFLILFPVPFIIHIIEQSFIYFVENRISEHELYERIEVSSGVVFLELSIMLCIKTIIFTVVTLTTFDLIYGNKIKTADYYRTAIRHFFPLLMLYLAYGLCASAALLLFIVPGLYLMAMWSVYLPATLAEQLTSGNFNRSTKLTEHYHWPIVVIFALFTGILIAVYSLVAILLGIGADEVFIPTINSEWGQFVFANSIGDSISEGLFAVGGVVVYCRLIELKGEGLNNPDLSAVFD